MRRLLSQPERGRYSLHNAYNVFSRIQYKQISSEWRQTQVCKEIKRKVEATLISTKNFKDRKVFEVFLWIKFMKILKFPVSNTSLYNTYVNRLDTANYEIDLLMQEAEVLNVKLAIAMRKYLNILSSFVQNCTPEEANKFLSTRAGSHNLQVIDNSFQLELPFGEEDYE